MVAQDRQVLGSLGDVADSSRCLPRIHFPFCLTTDSVWGSNVATKNTSPDSLAAVWSYDPVHSRELQVEVSWVQLPEKLPFS